ncbi:MAG: hypothetical protein M1435_00095 [Actinobacteria bacterium]|nr:hypothetical protein [Actinomycetota bacterium]
MGDEELALGVVVPSMFQSRVHDSVAAAVAGAWEAEHPRPLGAGAEAPVDDFSLPAGL